MEGPCNSFQCVTCQSSFRSLGLHAHHQKVHANNYNFCFQCGVCALAFSSFNSLTSHISKCHKAARHRMAHQSLSSYKCNYCDNCFQTMGEVCKHLKTDHIKIGENNIYCPFGDCGRVDPFKSEATFSKHLSQHHKGWQEAKAPIPPGSAPSEQGSGEGGEDDVFELFGNNEEEDDQIFHDANSFFEFDESDVFNFIGKYYLMMETECFLPVTTIDKIAENMKFLSEMVQCNMKNKMISELKSEGMSEEKIENLLCKLADSNILFLAHHKQMRGPNFTTEHFRRNFYKEKFGCLLPVSHNLSNDPLEPELYQFVPVRETLSKLLADSSVKKEVLESFDRFGKTNNSNLLKDYTDGSVCKNRKLPSRRLDLIVFQDAYKPTSMLTTVGEKHKCLGVYMTLGNLQPHLRTKLKAMQLVMMVLDQHVKKHRQKCFEKLQEELKDLEDNGIELMGEYVPVYLQFIVGDNLGAHFLGGFVESFTSTYPCRYCTITRAEFLADPTMLKPDRTQQDYERYASIAECQNLKHHKGVKVNSVFNKLDHFKVCDPGLPPCIGHDLFHGVADVDLSSMVSYFVSKKWFSYQVLNRRIASFEYSTTDIKNKPAPVKEDGNKLGGSAVQNWVLLRLLPLILEGLIVDPSDEIWKLYLLLKSICELVCAPAISEPQIDKLDLLVQSYLTNRIILPNNVFKPKHHYMRHYADLIRKLGPLIHLWGMRFEQKHQYFKKVARICNNFINLVYSLAFRHQLSFTYEGVGIRFPSIQVKCKPFPIRPGYFNNEVQAILTTALDLSNAQAAALVKINGLWYKEGGWLIFNQMLDFIEMCLIEAILFDSGKIFFILRKHIAMQNINFGLYEINENSPGELFTIEFESLPYPCPQPVYNYLDHLCFSLKHTCPLQLE